MGDEKKPAADIKQIEGLKVKKSRHYRREILQEDSKVLVTKVVHAKRELKDGTVVVVSDTKRKDHKFNPKQQTFFGRPL